MTRKNTKLCILGITGSIGTQTVAIAKKLGYKIVSCSYHKNIELGQKLVKYNKIPFSLCSHDTSKGNCLDFNNLIKKSKPDLVVNAIIGFAGLKATTAALKNKINIALANKESVVVGGKFIMPYAKKHNIKIIPIDSEHTNLYYQIAQAGYDNINQLYITCSGGKYWDKSKDQLKKVTYNQATSHKNWSMGQKITIDSNTLMNKCFEVIEAYWYFNTNRINVLLDPTSIIHSAILLNDGSFAISHSQPKMTNPIAWAISDFKTPLVLPAIPKTNVLYKINDIKPISWAYRVINDKTGSLGIILNAANEVAIQLFKKKMIRFDQILDFIENSMNKIKPTIIKSIDEIYTYDKLVRLQSIKYWK